MWFLGVLERLLRPLMRTLSLQNDTSQGDGGPPLSSHSPSSVVDASNVASNTMIPPSPTCNKQKKKKKKKRTNYENLWNVARWTFVDRVFEQSSRHDYYSTKYFHLRDENIHFPFGEKKFPRHVFENLPRYTGKVDFCLYEHSRPRALRLRCNLHANQTCPRRHRPIPRCSPEIKDCLENIGMCIWKAKRKGVILYNYLIETTNLELFVYYNSFANSHLELCIVLLI